MMSRLSDWRECSQTIECDLSVSLGKWEPTLALS
jgi:hypothetical protein